MPNFDVQTVQVVVLALVGVAVLLQVILVIAIFAAMSKMGKSIKDEIEDVRTSVLPIIFNTRELMTSLTPKIEATVDDMAALVHGLRTQSKEVESVSAEIVERLRRQSTRLDAMTTRLLDVVDRTGTVVVDTVNRPVRQLSGLVASAKAVVQSLRNSDSTPHPPHVRPSRRARGGDDTSV